MCRGHKFFLAPFHKFLAPKWAVFSRGGSLSEKCGQNLRNVGRRAVVMIIYYQYSLNMKTTALLPTFLRFWPHFSERHIYQHWMIMTVGRDNLYTSVQLVMWFSVCWSIHYKFFKPNVMQMFSEPSVRAAKQRKDQPGRRQQTVVKHGDVNAFVQHIDSGDDL